jgi:hypothetical protein
MHAEARQGPAVRPLSSEPPQHRPVQRFVLPQLSVRGPHRVAQLHEGRADLTVRGDTLGGPPAVNQRCRPYPRQSLGRPTPGAGSAVHPAASVRHGRDWHEPPSRVRAPQRGDAHAFVIASRQPCAWGGLRISDITPAPSSDAANPLPPRSADRRSPPVRLRSHGCAARWQSAGHRIGSAAGSACRLGKSRSAGKAPAIGPPQRLPSAASSAPRLLETCR